MGKYDRNLSRERGTYLHNDILMESEVVFIFFHEVFSTQICTTFLCVYLPILGAKGLSPVRPPMDNDG